MIQKLMDVNSKNKSFHLNFGNIAINKIVTSRLNDKSDPIKLGNPLDKKLLVIFSFSDCMEL